MNWLSRLLRTQHMEQQLDRELRFHLETQIEEKIDAGMSPAEARRTTYLEFGGLEQIKQQTRESRGTLWLTSVADDLRFGALTRGCIHHSRPVVTIAAARTIKAGRITCRAFPL